MIHNTVWGMLEKISKVPSRSWNLVISESWVSGLMIGQLENQAQKFEVGGRLLCKWGWQGVWER